LNRGRNTRLLSSLSAVTWGCLAEPPPPRLSLCAPASTRRGVFFARERGPRSFETWRGSPPPSRKENSFQILPIPFPGLLPAVASSPSFSPATFRSRGPNNLGCSRDSEALERTRPSFCGDLFRVPSSGGKPSFSLLRLFCEHV